MAIKKLEAESKPTPKKKTSVKKKAAPKSKEVKTPKVKKAKIKDSKPDVKVEAQESVQPMPTEHIDWQDAVWPTKLLDSMPEDKELTLDELLALIDEEDDDSGNEEQDKESSWTSDEVDKLIAAVVARYEAVAGPISDE